MILYLRSIWRQRQRQPQPQPWRRGLLLFIALLIYSSQSSHSFSFNRDSRPQTLFPTIPRSSKISSKSSIPSSKGTTTGGNFHRLLVLRSTTVYHDSSNGFEGDDTKSSTTTTTPVSSSSTPTTIPPPPSPPPHIAFWGGGIFFYHQAGIVTFLREEGYDLSACTFAGASAGALTATLAASGVDFYEATELALKQAEDAGVWDRSGGLQGIWGSLIEEWLDTLLPASIDNLQERVTLLVTPVPSFGKTRVSRFENRNDLINCCMTSVHLPWFLNGRLTSNFRGKPHIDGSFLSEEGDYYRTDNNNNKNRLESSSSPIDTIVLDWSQDPKMKSKGGLDIVEALSPDGIYDLLECGKRYGKIMEEQGMFQSLKKLP